MAKVTKKSSLASKLGKEGVAAIKKFRDAPPEFDTGGSLPAGIENGVARLNKCYFSTYDKGDNAGEYYFRASGIVLSPKIHQGVKIEGRHTSIMEPVCDTPNRSRQGVGEHIAWVLNEMKKLGADTADADVDDLEVIATALEGEAPAFTFRTWQGSPTEEYPNPRVNEVWNGVTEYGEDEEEDVDDDTKEDEDDTEKEEEDSEEEDSKEEDPEEDSEEDSEEEDLDALAEAADEDEDGEEAARLTEICEEAGIDPADYETWEEVVRVLRDDSEEDDPEEDDPVPTKEDVCQYKPPRAKKNVDCEVRTVSATKKTVTLKNLDDGKMYKDVPWVELVW